MGSGGCLCGNLKYEFTAEGGQKVLCHCPQCKRMTASAFSTNIVIPASTLTIQGTPKHHTFVRGEEIHTTTFCGDCGTTISKIVDGFEKFKGLAVIQAGTLDEGQGFEKMKMDAELYVTTRADWLKEIEGAKQVETAP